MADEAEPMDEHGLVAITNELLEQLHYRHRVNHVSEIGSTVFVTLYEGLCGEPLESKCHALLNVYK